MILFVYGALFVQAVNCGCGTSVTAQSEPGDQAYHAYPVNHASVPPFMAMLFTDGRDGQLVA